MTRNRHWLNGMGIVFYNTAATSAAWRLQRSDVRRVCRPRVKLDVSTAG